MKKLILSITLILLCFLMYLVWTQLIQNKKFSVSPHDSPHITSPDSAVILYWTPFFWVKWLDWEGIHDCGGQIKCYFTEDRNLFKNSSLVVFHANTYSFMTYILSLFALHHHRPKGQRWVYVNGESPYRSRVHYFLKRPIFNWTMTYRPDSDIFEPYGEVIPGKYQNGFNKQKNYLEGKSIEATAAISYCKSSGRLKVVKALSKYMEVNLLGRCAGTLFHEVYSTTEDRNSQIRKSKFYLAFENSICKDYITEKTYHNALFNRAVPVILSGANLSNPLVMPPGSYIDASTFNSAKELADHLIYIGQSKERYNKFFEWREHWTIRESYFQDSIHRCRLCKKLHQSSPSDIKVHEDLSGLKAFQTECKPYPSLQ